MPTVQTTRNLALAALVAVTALLAGACASAHACGDVKRAHAAGRGQGTRAPLVIGDSVLLGAVAPVAAVGFEVDTRGCRQMAEGLRVIAARRRARTLPHLVVLALGTNGSVRIGDIRAAMRLLGSERVLGLVTPRELGGGSGADARVVRAAGRRFGARVHVLDWVRASSRRTGWFAGDGIHLGRGGAVGFARLLQGALPFAIAPLCP